MRFLIDELKPFISCNLKRCFCTTSSIRVPVPTQVLTALPSRVDLRPQCPPVNDQDQLGSATSNAIAAAIQFDLMKQHLQDFIPSRLFIYYYQRVMEGTTDSDSGAQIRDGIKSVAIQGVCPMIPVASLQLTMS